jgi:hypothetical protein
MVDFPGCWAMQDSNQRQTDKKSVENPSVNQRVAAVTQLLALAPD